MTKLTKAQSVAASLIVPFLVQAAIIVPAQKLNLWLSGILSIANFAVFGISSGAGFVFIIRRFRSSAIAIALVYFPAIIYLLVYFSLTLIGRVFGDWL